MSEIDPVDIAYLAIGAHGAKRRADEEMEAIVLGQMGEVDYISEVVSYAPVLATLWAEWEEQNDGEGFPGCWAYEVAEEFGEKLGLAMIQGRDLNVSIALEMCRGVIAQATKRSEH